MGPEVPAVQEDLQSHWIHLLLQDPLHQVLQPSLEFHLLLEDPEALVVLAVLGVLIPLHLHPFPPPLQLALVDQEVLGARMDPLYLGHRLLLLVQGCPVFLFHLLDLVILAHH